MQNIYREKIKFYELDSKAPLIFTEAWISSVTIFQD